MQSSNKISRNEVIPILLDKCPGISSYWEEHVNFYDAESRAGGYLDIGVIAHFIVRQFKAGETAFLPDFFHTVEEILNNCDERS